MKIKIDPYLISEAYAEAADHLEACAAEEQSQATKAAYLAVSAKLNAKAKAVAHKAVKTPPPTR